MGQRHMVDEMDERHMVSVLSADVAYALLPGPSTGCLQILEKNSAK
jgi:hypothetical protein